MVLITKLKICSLFSNPLQNPSVKNPNNDPGQKFQNELKNKKQGKYKLRSRNIAGECNFKIT